MIGEFAIDDTTATGVEQLEAVFREQFLELGLDDVRQPGIDRLGVGSGQNTEDRNLPRDDFIVAVFLKSGARDVQAGEQNGEPSKEEGKSQGELDSEPTNEVVREERSWRHSFIATVGFASDSTS